MDALHIIRRPVGGLFLGGRSSLIGICCAYFWEFAFKSVLSKIQIPLLNGVLMPNLPEVDEILKSIRTQTEMQKQRSKQDELLTLQISQLNRLALENFDEIIKILQQYSDQFRHADPGLKCRLEKSSGDCYNFYFQNRTCTIQSIFLDCGPAKAVGLKLSAGSSRSSEFIFLDNGGHLGWRTYGQHMPLQALPLAANEIAKRILNLCTNSAT